MVSWETSYMHAKFVHVFSSNGVTVPCCSPYTHTFYLYLHAYHYMKTFYVWIITASTPLSALHESYIIMQLVAFSNTKVPPYKYLYMYILITAAFLILEPIVNNSIIHQMQSIIRFINMITPESTSYQHGNSCILGK